MRLALFGIDDESTAIAEQLVAAGGHTVAWGYAPDESRAERIRQHFPLAECSRDWLGLLAGPVEAVIVGGGDIDRGRADDDRIEVLRKLVQEGVPVIIAYPLHDSMLVYFELDMIRRERSTPMVPWLPGRLHPAVAALAQLVDGPAPRLGRLQQCTLEREAPRSDRRAAKSWLVCDIDLARALCGNLTKVAAMSAGGEESAAPELSTLAVQFSSDTGAVSRWAFVPGDDAAELRITLVGSQGRAFLALREAAPVRLETRIEGQTEAIEFAAWDPAPAMDEVIGLALRGEPYAPNWSDAVRSAELLDAVQRSLERGRMVELFQEEASEESTFKGMMAAGGCLLLLLGMFITVAASTAGGLGLGLADYWPLALLIVLGGFLLLQTFGLVFPAK